MLSPGGIEPILKCSKAANARMSVTSEAGTIAIAEKPRR